MPTAADSVQLNSLFHFLKHVEKIHSQYDSLLILVYIQILISTCHQQYRESESRLLKASSYLCACLPAQGILHRPEKFATCI